jgi:K+-transporting ATPase ATPase A chain
MLGGLIGFALWRAIVRAISRKGLGNAWGALWRGILFLGPFQILLGAVLVWQGVAQDPMGASIPTSAVASFGSASMVSASGTGITAAGFASQIMNPTPITDWSFLLALIGIPMGLFLAAGELIHKPVLARRITFGMGLILALATTFTVAEMPPYPGAFHADLSQALWMNATAASSNGGVNEPLERYGRAGILPAFMGLIGPLPFTPAMGFGTGLLFFSLATALFMAALMTGKSPDFLGFSIRRTEVAAVLTGILGPPVAVLIGIAIVAQLPHTIDLIRSGGAHAASAILYFLTSATQTNGSAYSMAVADDTFLKVAMGLMIVGRLLVIGPILAFAGCLEAQRELPPLKPAISSTSWVVIIFFFAAAVFNAVLTMAPVLMMGPILEAL